MTCKIGVTLNRDTRQCEPYWDKPHAPSRGMGVSFLLDTPRPPTGLCRSAIMVAAGECHGVDSLFEGR
jgi:hypothetical protein